MPKARLLRPEFWTDEKVVGMSPLARLLFAGMWNFACDNGHLDDSVIQLKMKVLPGDPVDVGELLDEVIASGTVARKDGYLKVLNLSKQQPLDLRFLVFCDHCDHDPERRYSREDKKPARRPHGGDTRDTRVQHDERTTGTRRSGDVDGDVDGDGDKPARKRATRKPELPLPADWQPNDNHRTYASSKHLDLEREAFRFRNHATANDRRQRDWNAAFTNWLDKAFPAAPSRSNRGQMPEGW